jgi:hypothetical protein
MSGIILTFELAECKLPLFSSRTMGVFLIQKESQCEIEQFECGKSEYVA